MKNPFVLKHGYGCLSKLMLITLFMLIITIPLMAQKAGSEEATKIDSTVVKKIDLSGNYEKQIEELSVALEKRYFELMINDPLTVERLKAITATDPIANQFLGAINLLTKLNKDLNLKKELKK